MISRCWTTVMMINRNKTTLLLVFLLVVAGGILFGQRSDFQTWFEAEADMGLKNGIDLSAEIEQRFQNYTTQFDRTLLTVAAEYDLSDYFSAAGGLRMLAVNDPESRVSTGFRIHADVKGNHSFSDVDLSLRIRFQYGFEEILYFNEFSNNSFVNRIRVKAAYHIFGTKLGIFGSMESWGLIARDTGRFFKRMRYSLGAEYSLNFRSEFNLRYIFEDEFNQPDPLQAHILVLGYSYAL